MSMEQIVIVRMAIIEKKVHSNSHHIENENINILNEMFWMWLFISVISDYYKSLVPRYGLFFASR